MLISASDIIKKSVDLYKNNFKLFAMYSLLMIVPTLIIMMGAATLQLFLASVESLALGLISFVILVVIAVLFSIWASMALIKVIVQRYHGMPAENMKSNLGNTAHLILPSIWISILTGLAVLGGTILLIIPGIIFAIWFGFGLYALVLEGKRGSEALTYSKSLVSGRWFGVVWRLFVPALVFVIIIWIAQGILAIGFGATASAGEGNLVAGVIYGLLNGAISVLVTPLTTSAPTILYEELKKTPLIPQAPESSEVPTV